MIGNKEKYEYSDEEDGFISSPTQHNALHTVDTKLQRILKTLLINVSFVAMVSNVVGKSQ